MWGRRMWSGIVDGDAEGVSLVRVMKSYAYRQRHATAFTITLSYAVSRGASSHDESRESRYRNFHPIQEQKVARCES